MQRREFMLKTAASLAAGGFAAGCTTAVPTVTPETKSSGRDERSEIEQGIDRTLERLYATAPQSRELVGKASGVVVFPNVIAAGLGIGGEYGKGALRVKKTTVGYYRLVSVSVGLQIGAQSKAVIFLLMTQDALDKFRSSPSWAVGVDASVALIKVGANGAIDASSVSGPVLGFVLTNAGLMANLSLEGTRITPIKL
jgi:lipid-binding SYLF domain-containing protein